MIESAELEIRSLLRKNLSSQDLLNQLSQRISDSSTPWEERRFFWYYLYNSGCVQEVWQLLHEHLLQKNRIPFDLLIEVAGKFKLNPSENVLDAIIKGLKKQTALSDLFSAFSFDKWDPRLIEIRGVVQKRQEDQQKQVRIDLVEKFEFLKNERMTAQATEVLAQLRKLYPDDPEFVNYEAQFKQQWAREVVASSSSSHNDLEITESKKIPLSEGDHTMLQLFVKEAELLSQHNKHIAYDMAICCWFFEEYEAALAAIEFAPISIATDWMMAELLLQARRFVECLEHLNAIELKYVADPETSFAVSYLRAQALKKLGQRDQALQILNDIIQLRPNYRSARNLIREWSKG